MRTGLFFRGFSGINQRSGVHSLGEKAIKPGAYTDIEIDRAKKGCSLHTPGTNPVQESLSLQNLGQNGKQGGV
jgi:hypothetical protein